MHGQLMIAGITLLVGPIAESLMAMNEPREEAETFVPRSRNAG